MTIKELQEKRNKLLVDAQAIMSKESVSAEERTNVDKMLADSNDLKADIERLQSIEAENRSSGRIPRDNPSGSAQEVPAENRSWQERRAATNRALRSVFGTTDAAAAAVARAQAIESRDLSISSNGSVMIPVGATEPRVARQSWGSIYDVIGKLRTTTGEAVKIPYVNDTTNLFVLNSAALTTTDPATGGVTSQIDDIRMNPILIEYSLIQDVGFDLVGFIENVCSQRYLRTASKWATLGNTSNVTGYATASGYNTGVTANTTLTTKYADITSLIAALDPAYSIGACFTMSNATLMNQVLQIVDGQQRPIFLPFNDGGISGFAGTIFGYPVKINPFQPNVAVGAFYMHFGNFDAGYVFREVGTPDPDAPNRLPGQGVVMLRRLDERYAELNKVGFVAFARVGGCVTNPGSVGSTPAPVVALIGK